MIRMNGGSILTILAGDIHSIKWTSRVIYWTQVLFPAVNILSHKASCLTYVPVNMDLVFKTGSLRFNESSRTTCANICGGTHGRSAFRFGKAESVCECLGTNKWENRKKFDLPPLTLSHEGASSNYLNSDLVFGGAMVLMYLLLKSLPNILFFDTLRENSEDREDSCT